MHIVVAYDIPDDKRRTRLAKRLSGLLERVQFSVFEGALTSEEEGRLEGVVTGTIDPAEDCVTVWRLCARCRPAIRLFGTAMAPPDRNEDTVI